MSVLNRVKCQGPLFPFLQGWGYYKELNRDQDEDPFFDKNAHRQSLIVRI